MADSGGGNTWSEILGFLGTAIGGVLGYQSNKEAGAEAGALAQLNRKDVLGQARISNEQKQQEIGISQAGLDLNRQSLALDTRKYNNTQVAATAKYFTDMANSNAQSRAQILSLFGR
jgi:hypothetical protein